MLKWLLCGCLPPELSSLCSVGRVGTLPPVKRKSELLEVESLMSNQNCAELSFTGLAANHNITMVSE